MAEKARRGEWPAQGHTALWNRKCCSSKGCPASSPRTQAQALIPRGDTAGRCSNRSGELLGRGSEGCPPSTRAGPGTAAPGRGRLTQHDGVHGSPRAELDHDLQKTQGKVTKSRGAQCEARGPRGPPPARPAGPEPVLARPSSRGPGACPLCATPLIGPQPSHGAPAPRGVAGALLFPEKGKPGCRGNLRVQ